MINAVNTYTCVAGFKGEYNTAVSNVCRYITRVADSLGYIDTINPYAYCGNNPINWVDPCGEWSRLRDGTKNGGHPGTSGGQGGKGGTGRPSNGNTRIRGRGGDKDPCPTNPYSHFVEGSGLPPEYSQMIYDGPDFIGPMRKLGPILALLDYVAELLRLHNDAEDAAKERALTGSIGLM